MAAGIARRAWMLRDLKHLSCRRSGPNDQVAQQCVPTGRERRPRRNDPGSAVEDENAREDDHLEHKSLGVADPAEDRKRQRSRPPVRRLDVALDGGVLRYERMERDISRP